MSRRAGGRVAGLLAAGLLAVTACSTGDDGGGEGGDAGARGATDDEEARRAARAEGPTADLSEEIAGGDGVLLGGLVDLDLDAVGWVESEHVAAGTAVSWRADGDLPGDGTYELIEDQEAPYRTRVVVRRPADAADFDGTVVVEWLNVSGGVDASPDWSFMADELVRGGYAWVGVSAQLIGVEGGPVAVSAGIGEDLAGRGLTAIDPDRYGSLEHPGDAFSYDIFTRVGRAILAGELTDLVAERVLAVGESQSAFALTTYVNGVHPRAGVFDGFLLHSRGAAALPLGAPGEPNEIAGAIGGGPVRIRTDLDVPVMMLQAEGDLVSAIGYHAARQPDTDMIRLWEVAGASHADRYLVGPLTDLVDCGVPINDGPHRFVVRAALRALDTWARTGEPPPEAPRIEIDDTGGAPVIRRDEDGIALGGIRTPQVDVPVVALSGEPGPVGGVICMLLGSTLPIDGDRLVELHGSRDGYLDAYEAAAEAAIEAGFVLPGERDELLDDAHPDLVPE